MTPRRVFATYLWIAGLYSLAASLVWGIHLLFLLAAGLDLLEVFLVHAAYTAAIVVFEIPTGVVADARGRRTSVLLSLVALAAGTLVYLGAAGAGAGLGVFCLGSVALGLGSTLYSGAAEAWLVDALESAGHRGPLAPLLARGQVVTSAVTVAATLAGGLLASLDLSYPYLLRVALLAPLFALAWRKMDEPGFTPVGVRGPALARELERIARASVAHGWKRPGVRALVLVGLVHYGFLSWAFHAWQPYFLELLGRDAPWVAGGVASLVTLATLAGNAAVVRLGRFSGRRVLLWAAAAQTAAAVGVGLAGSFPLAVALLLTMAAAAGVVGPVKQALLHRLIPSRARATVISFDSLVANAGGIGGQTGLGYLARAHGVASSYVLGGLLSGLALPVLARLRRLDVPAERLKEA